MADVTYAQAVMAERRANDPAPVAGTPLGGGLVALDVVLYVTDPAGTPVPIQTGDFTPASAGGGGTVTVVSDPSYAHLLAFGGV